MNLLRQLMRRLAWIWAPSRAPSLGLFVMLAAVIAANTIYPLYQEFHPADDYAIYEYFAEAVDKGQNPYSIAPDYRSEIVPKFFYVGFTQPEKGVIRQTYADYPPLFFLINSVAFRIDTLKGLYYLYIALYAVSMAMFVIYATSRSSGMQVPAATPLVLLLFFGTNPIFSSLWFHPIDDKVWFAFFMTALLVFRNRPYAVVVLLGLLAATQGLGIPIMALYVVHLWVSKGARREQILRLLLVFGLILALSHLLWFPDWLKGYAQRAHRQTSIAHESLFIPLKNLGLDLGYAPLALTVFFFSVLVVLVAGKRLELEEIMLLPIVAFFIFGTDAPFNRLLVIILALLLLTRHNRTIVISYVLGAFLSLTSMSVFSWRIMWAWIFYLLAETAIDIFRRNLARPSAEVQAAARPATSALASRVRDA